MNLLHPLPVMQEVLLEIVLAIIDVRHPFRTSAEQAFEAAPVVA